MPKGTVSVPEAQRQVIARLVQDHGAREFCDVAGVRSTQSLFRALAGAPVLPLTLLALQRACEKFAAGAAEVGNGGGKAS